MATVVEPRSKPSKIQQILNEIYLLTLGLIVILFLCVYIILFIPTFIIRPIAKLLKPYLRPDLGEICSLIASMFAQVDEEDFDKTVIVSQFVVDGEIDFRKSLKDFEAKVIHAKLPNGQLRYPELLQYITSWMGYKFWKWETDFNINNHVKIHVPPTPGKFSSEEIRALGDELLKNSLPKYLSPWEFTIVEGVQRDNSTQKCSVCYFRIHHAIADGFSVLFLFQRFFGNEKPEPPVPARYAKINLRYFLLFPFRTLRVFGELAHNTASSFTWKIAESKKSRQHFHCPGKFIPVETLMKIKNQYGVCFTSVVFAALTGGIRKFLENSKTIENSSPLPCIITVPVGSHPDKLINKFSFALTNYPVDEPDPVKRLYILKGHYEDLRESPVPLIGYIVALLHGCHFNPIGRILNTYKYAPMITTYFPIGDKTWHIQGHEITEFCFYLRLYQGDQGVLFTIASYRGGIVITPVVNAAIMSKAEVEQLSSYITEEISVLLNYKEN